MFNTILVNSNTQRCWKKKLSPEHQKQYDLGNIGEYDKNTLIYDIFIGNDNKTVIAILPPPVNLKSSLFPLFLDVNGKRKKFSLSLKDRKMSVFKLTLDTPLKEDLPCTLLLPQGQHDITLRHKTQILTGLSLVTLQKNNPVSWIKDWIDFYRSQFGIDHIYIYDNNSDNYQELCQALKGLATVVPWNFPYGPHYQHDNSFAQIGALNHFKFKYGHDCTIFNFDIDELLFCNDNNIKETIIASDYARINSYQGSPILPSTPKDYSFKHFLYREEKPRNCAYKYVVKGHLGYLRVHKHSFFQNRFYYLQLAKAGVHALRHFFSSKKARNPYDVMPITQAYFIHYTPITTGWKETDRSKIKPLDLDKFVLDKLAERVFT